MKTPVLLQSSDLAMPVQVFVTKVSCDCFRVLVIDCSFSNFLAAVIAALKCFWNAANDGVSCQPIVAGDVVVSSES